MGVSTENLPYYVALQKKMFALYDCIDGLLLQRDPANQFDVDRSIERAHFEIRRIDAVRSDLRNNEPISFPSSEQFAAMQDSVRGLRQAINDGAAWSALIAAGSAVIAAWPT